MPPNSAKDITITNVRLFSPKSLTLTEPRTVCISNGKVVDRLPSDASPEVVDGSGRTLLPGLIDAHVHLSNTSQIKILAQWGVTTALDMACWPPSTVSSLKDYASTNRLTDIRSAGLPATSPGSRHSKFLPLPKEALLERSEQVETWVQKRVDEGSDYVKLIVDNPGPSQEVLNALAQSAREKGRMSIAHAGNREAWSMALDAGVDVVTHVPMSGVLESEMAERVSKEGRIAVPTLSMMEGLCRKLWVVRRGLDFRHSVESVRALHKAGVKIAAGTDANTTWFGYVSYGESLHHELELMVRAGLSNGEALRAATLGAAEAFGLGDRGVVEVGKRADLVLVEGDPLGDVRMTRKIRKVWCGGVEVDRRELESWWYTTAIGRWVSWVISFFPGSQ